MATIAKLVVELGMEDGAFQRGIESARSKLDALGSKFRSVGTGLTAGVTTPLVAAGGAFINWAASMEQTVGATEVLWGDNADAMMAWSKTASTSMGMSQQDALANANRFNAMFKTIGAGEGVVKDMSQGFTMLSSDLSAMWGGNPSEAADALTSALRGNYEGLDKYNINLTEAMVSQEAMNVAMADGRSEVTEADKTQARYNLIMEQSADAQGQFGRETNTTAGRMAIMKARIKDIGTQFGNILLPYVNKALNVFGKLATWFEKLSDRSRKWVVVIAAIAAAMGPVLLIIGMMLPGLSALLAVIGFLISPIGLVVLGIAALAAGLIYAYTHFEGFRNIVNTVAGAIKDFWNALTSGDAIGKLQELSNQLMAWIQGTADNLIAGASSMAAAGIAWLQGLWDGAVGKWNEVTAWLGGLAAEALTWIGETASTLYTKGSELLQGLWDGVLEKWIAVSLWFVNLATMIFNAIADVTGTLLSRGTDILQGFWQGVLDKWVAVSTWFVNLATMIFNAIGTLTSTIKSKGTDILQGFWQGVLDKWVAVSTWFLSLGSMILGAIGDLGSSLYGAGTAVMDGLWQGLKDGWGQITGWLSGLNPADWKGPEARDKKMLYMPGVWIMEGLGRGLDEGWGDVTRQLSGYSPALTGNIGSANAGIGGGQVIQIITLEPGKWREFLADAQAGGKMARGFGSEIAMMEGFA